MRKNKLNYIANLGECQHFRRLHNFHVNKRLKIDIFLPLNNNCAIILLSDFAF